MIVLHKFNLHFYSLYSLILVLVSTPYSYGQTPAYRIVEKLPLTSWSGMEKGVDLSDQEKLNLLKMLPEGERVEFESDYDEETKEATYFELSFYGLKFIDLDFDGDLDLLYSSLRRGGMGQLSTKVYYNQNSVLTYFTTLREGLIDIKKEGNSYLVFTQFHPCCDSYTTRIDQFKFSAKVKARFVESVSLIGRSYYRYKGMPNFATKKTITMDSTTIYAFKTDLRGGYFGKRNKEVRTKLRVNGVVKLLKIETETKAGVLAEAEFKGKKVFLVITNPLNNLPNFPTSLYEKSHGDDRRLVGWVKVEEVE